jgi:hypothetical protein
MMGGEEPIPETLSAGISNVYHITENVQYQFGTGNGNVVMYIV